MLFQKEAHTKYRYSNSDSYKQQGKGGITLDFDLYVAIVRSTGFDDKAIFYQDLEGLKKTGTVRILRKHVTQGAILKVSSL